MELTAQLRLIFLAGLVAVAAIAVGAGLALSWLRGLGTRRLRSHLPQARPVVEGAEDGEGGEQPRGRASRAA